MLITNLPPSPMPVVESLKFGGMSYLQLAEHMAAVRLGIVFVTSKKTILYFIKIVFHP